MKVTKSDGTVVENTYDVDGVLVRTAVNGVGVDYLVDTSGGLSHVVAEVDSSGTVTTLYVRAGGMLLEEVRGGVAKMYEADGLGSVRGLLDVSGTRTDTYAYEAFGSTVSSTGSDANPYRFAGERLVDSVGFYQNRARWLDTRTGRFVSVDPAEGQDENPISLQPYLYGAANPVIYVDATGEDETLVGLMVGVGAYTILSGTALATGNGVTRGSGTLVIYGWPPSMRSLDENGDYNPNGSVVWKYMPKYHRASLEAALRTDVEAELGGRITVTAVAPGMNSSAIQRAAQGGSYESIVYVGESMASLGLTPILNRADDRRPETFVTGADLASFLRPSVKRVWILGCYSSYIAQEASAIRKDVTFVGADSNAQWGVRFRLAKEMKDRLVTDVWFRGTKKQ